MVTYNELVARHNDLHAQFIDNPESLALPEVERFIGEMREAGATTADAEQRQQLRAMLRYWGRFTAERTGEFPNTALMPLEGSQSGVFLLPTQMEPAPTTSGAAGTSGLRPVNGSAATGDAAAGSAAPTPVTDSSASSGGSERPFWFWPVVALLALLSIILAIVFYRALWGNDAESTTTTADTSAVVTPLASVPVVAGDSDGDGLSDEQEAVFGTNSSLADTDGDGLTDGIEVLQYNTNPLNPDTDYDGVPDREEIEQGASPLEPATVVDQPTAAAYPAATATVAPPPPPTVAFSGPTLVIVGQEGQTSVPVLTGPGQQYAPVTEVAVGTTVLIVRRTPDNSWYSIELADLTRGWIPASNAQVDPATNVAAVPTFVPPGQ